MTDAPLASPILTFHRLIEQARPPMRADRSAIGTLPTRAFRYCEAVTTATAFGWYVFPPIGLTLMWDGSQVFWTYDGAEHDGWIPLNGSAQFPYFAQAFDEVAPEGIKGFSPPFLSALREPGVVQIWSGLIARTAPGWGLLVRGPVNLPRGHYELYEGIIETDRWFGPLFSNIRLTKTDVQVRLEPDYPIFQAVPLPRTLYSDETMQSVAVTTRLADLTEDDWADYEDTVVRPNVDPNRQRGAYAMRTRKRRKGETPHAVMAGSGEE